MRTSQVLLVLVSVFAVGCRSKKASPAAAVPAALSQYESAPLVVGTGLGDLQLGVTTLADVVGKLGPGAASGVVGDEVAIELRYLGGQLGVQFIVSKDCQDEAGGARRITEVVRNTSGFPLCGATPLTSVFVSNEGLEEAWFYKGATDHGVSLGSPITHAGKHGEVLKRPGQLVAGERPDAQLDRVEVQGAYFYSAAPPGPTAEETFAGRPLPPERLEAIKKAAADPRNLAIRRITLFAPAN